MTGRHRLEAAVKKFGSNTDVLLAKSSLRGPNPHNPWRAPNPGQAVVDAPLLQQETGAAAPSMPEDERVFAQMKVLQTPSASAKLAKLAC